MSRLSKQSIRKLCVGVGDPMIIPFQLEKIVVNGKSGGLSHASYDCHIDHDLELGINPAFIIAKHHIRSSPTWKEFLYREKPPGMLELVEKLYRDNDILAEELKRNPPMKSLAYTVEDFNIPAGISGDVADKSTYARVFISAFNTFFDPGFHGNGTLELVNHGDELISYKKGDPVCQMIFNWLDEPTEDPYRGKYQHQTKAAHGPRYEQN